MNEIEMGLGHMGHCVHRHGNMREDEGLQQIVLVRMRNEFGNVVGGKAGKFGGVSYLWNVG